MEFNFYEQFSNYPTGDLLEIVQQPDKYQPEAINAAELLLKERVVSESERDDVHRQLVTTQVEKQHRSEQAAARMQKIAELISPTVSPEKGLSPRRLFFLLLAAYAVSYCYFFYGFVKDQLRLLSCDSCRADSGMMFGFLLLTYETITFFLLVRKKRWGWILLFVFHVASGLTLLYELYYWHKTIGSIPGFNHRITPAMILTVIYPIAMAFFLWSPAMARIFGVDRMTRNYSLLAGAVIGVGLMVLFS